MKKRVLLVDDEPSVRTSLSDLLEFWGYEVCDLAATGEDAIKKSEAVKPDLVMMDIKLKGPIDGIESARAIKKRDNTPIIFMTGYINENLKKEAAAVQPAAYLEKPFNLDELKSALDLAIQEINFRR